MVVLTHSTIWDRWGQSERFIYIWATGQSPQGCTAPPVSASVRLSSPQPGFTKYPALHLPFPRAASSPSCAELCPVLGTGRFPIALFPARSWKGHPTISGVQLCSVELHFLSPDIWNVSYRGQIWGLSSLYAACRKEEGRGFALQMSSNCFLFN